MRMTVWKMSKHFVYKLSYSYVFMWTSAKSLYFKWYHYFIAFCEWHEKAWKMWSIAEWLFHYRTIREYLFLVMHVSNGQPLGLQTSLNRKIIKHLLTNLKLFFIIVSRREKQLKFRDQKLRMLCKECCFLIIEQMYSNIHHICINFVVVFPTKYWTVRLHRLLMYIQLYASIFCHTFWVALSILTLY